MRQFEHTGDPIYINEAIKCHIKASSLLPNDSPVLPQLLLNLGNAHNCRSRIQTQEEGDSINTAIKYQKHALSLLPTNHPYLPLFFSSLGNSYLRKHVTLDDPVSILDSLTCFRKSAQSCSGNPRTKLQAAESSARVALKTGGEDVLDAFQIAMDLVPAVVWLGTIVNQRYKDVKKIGALATKAAAAAIQFRKYNLAIEWLEQGRSVVWNQLLQLRTPHDQLFIDHPTIAEELKCISAELHASDSLSSSLSWDFTPSQSLEAGVQRHHRLAENYDRALNKIRKLPGYADFLRPKAFSTLKSAASDGPVIVINLHGPHSDALVVSPERADIMHVPLPDWTSAAANMACHQINSVLKSRGMGRDRDSFQRHFMAPDSEPESGNDLETALYTLWADVIHPILDSLGYLNPEKRSPLPHITWCTAGVMSFLPLHAAGNYAERGPKTTDFVVSSYTPTLNALLPENTLVFPSPLRVLAVGQATTPGHAPLPATKREIFSIKDIIQAPNQITEIEDQNATKQAVLAAMESHDWVHLACHAHQSIGDPEESGFFLQDGTLSLATINKKQFKNKGLAFLSACQTATGDESLPDEVVHLAAGMLTAGYPSVIATMWSVMDSDAPVVAEKVYSELLKGKGTGCGAIARALDIAVAELRNQIGEDQLWRWVPYIHFGV